MRRLTFLLFAASFILHAQPGTITGCEFTADRAGVRPGGLTELIGAMKLTCRFNGALPANAAVPRYNFLVTLFGGGNPVNVTSRPLASTPNNALVANDALLVLDEPAPANQTICTDFPLVSLLTANGSIPPLPNTCLGLPGQPKPNVFYGASLPTVPNAQNSLVYLGVPIQNPFDPAAQRFIHMANLRAITQNLRPGQNISASVQMTGPGGAIRITNPEQIVAVVQQPPVYSVRNAANTADPFDAGYVIQNNCADPFPVLPRRSVATLKWTESEVNQFLQRTAAPGAQDSSPLPAAQANINDPNFYTSVYGTTETGFYNPNFRIPNVVIPLGLADFGTRFKAAFKNIPAGLDLFVPRCATSSSGGLVCLTRSEVSGYSPYPPGLDIVQIPLTNGAGSAIWEMLIAQTRVENLSMTVSLSSPGGSNRPQPGTGTVTMSFAPLSTVTTASGNAPIPRFADSSPAADAANVGNVANVVTVRHCSNVPPFSYINAASGNATAAAPDSIVSGFGQNLASGLATSGLPLSSRLLATRLEVTDSRGTTRDGSLFFVSPGQINFLIPPGTAAGPGNLTVFNGSNIAGQGAINIVNFAPGIFSADNSGKGPAAAQVVTVEADGSQTVSPTSTFDASGKAVPIPFAAGPKPTALVLYATGARGYQSVQPNLIVRIGDQSYTPFAVAPHAIYPGLDQVNVLLSPGPTGGTGVQTVFLSDPAGNKLSNEVTIDINGYFPPQ